MTDQQYMQRAIQLAKKGEGWTNPNPMVGAVIVKDGRVIGEGYHKKCGELHAERNAIASLTESAQGATMYVTLEPCCHYGKTPPCTEAILEQKIGKVVIGSRDPNPKVAGKGAQILRKAGVTVVEDFMREECDRLNPVFFHYITTKTPYVVLKYAMTIDGKIAAYTGESKWISNENSRQRVHEMRNRYMGIMVGIGTVLADNPNLTCRMDGGRNPIRIVCDSKLRIPLDCNLVKTAGEVETIVAYTVCNENDSQAMTDKINKLNQAGVVTIEVSQTDLGLDLNDLMVKLGKRGIDGIMIEGGGTLNYSAVMSGIVNEVDVFLAPKVLGGVDAITPVEGQGVETPDIAKMFVPKGMEQIDDDIYIRYVAR